MINFVQKIRFCISRLVSRSATLGHFSKNDRGVAAIEFAMISPLLIFLFFGTVEISQGVGADRKATLLARTLADLVSQFSNVTDNDINNIFLAATAVMTPYAADSTKLKSVITAVSVDATGKATVAWSDTKYGNDSSTSSTKFADYTLNQTVTLPAALAVPNTQLIWSQVTYTYSSPVSYFVIGNKLLNEQNYVRPRQTASVTRSVS